MIHATVAYRLAFARDRSCHLLVSSSITVVWMWVRFRNKLRFRMTLCNALTAKAAPAVGGKAVR